MAEEVIGETKPVSVSTIKKGSNVVIEGAPCRVVDVQTSRPGKHGHAKCRIEAVGILDDKKRMVVMPGHDTVETPVIGKKTAQVLSITGDMANVMDIETYETFDMKIPDELKAEVREGCQVLYWTIMDAKVMKQVKSE